MHILSIEDVNADDPLAGFHLLDEELRQFDPALADKPQLRVINKIDTVDAERLAEVRAAFDRLGVPVYVMSALQEIGVTEMLEAMWAMQARLAREDESTDGAGD